MEDIDRSGLLASHDIDLEQLKLELYRLITMFLSSDKLTDMILSDIRTGKVRDFGTHFMGMLEGLFYGEMSRILLYTAIQCRVFANNEYQRSIPLWDKTCGELENTKKKDAAVGLGPLGGETSPLTLREAFNKIIHAEAINLDLEDAEDEGLWLPQIKVNPLLYLYGRTQSGNPWRAILRIIDYVRWITFALPRVG
jgi:hypothetical protein